MKAKELEKAVAKMKEAVELGEKDGLPAEERGLLLYQYALALERNKQSTEAITVLRKAAQLAPKDADIRIELAQRLLDDDQYAEAKKEAEEALRLGLEDADDQKEAARIIKKSKLEMLHERFTFYGGVSFAFDSNVLQGAQRETIAGRNTGGATGGRPKAEKLGDRADAILLANKLQLRSTYAEAVRAVFRQEAAAPQQEYDFPLNIFFDLGGRLVGNTAAQLWLGYRFSQSIMFSPQRTPSLYPDGSPQTRNDRPLYDKDHDSYSSQEHTANLSFAWTPTKWLVLRPRIDGFVNFTGLRNFAPFQGGMLAVLDSSFIESRLFRTRLLYQHQLRRSFDRENDVDLDGNRDEVRLAQELRLRGTSVSARGVLSYRFRSDRSGVLTSYPSYTPSLIIQYGPQDPAAVVPRGVPALLTRNPAVEIGQFTYQSSLSYFAHEAAMRWRISLPRGVEILAGLGYEYRTYPTEYRTTQYDGFAIVPDPDSDQRKYPAKPNPLTYKDPLSGNMSVDTTGWVAWVCTMRDPAQRCTSTIAQQTFTEPYYSQRRVDHLVSADLTLSKDLPLGFGLDLGYSFLRNFSSIANIADNRNYTKHLVQLSLYYSF